MEPVAPKRRGWRQLIGIAAGTATMSLGAGIASAQGGTTPAPGDDFKLSSAEATPHKTYFDGRRAPTVSYTFQGSAPGVSVEIVNAETAEVVDTITDPAAAPNTPNVATWDGTTLAGTPAPNGEYLFRIASAAGGTPQTTAEATFGYHKFRFPLRARHEFGEGFGAGRNHQGQDVFARCGTPIYAARGGRVQWNKVHEAAGNYLVIDLKGTGADQMYAHLRERSDLQPGARVRTGEPIGNVGDTGNASGCHLHFEIWSAPGWYEGGEALASVGRLLKLWDTWS